MRKLPLFGGRLPQGCLMDDNDNITHIFDDSQLLNDRLRHLVRWWKDSRFKDAPPPTLGHVQTANGKRYDIPHHGQWFEREGLGIAHDDGKKRTIYDENFKYVKTVDSDRLTPVEIVDLCKTFEVSLQGADYKKGLRVAVFGNKGGLRVAVFGNKGTTPISVYDLNNVKKSKQLFYNRIEKWWMSIVKNWEAESKCGVALSLNDHA